jgi:hypothetical protein
MNALRGGNYRLCILWTHALESRWSKNWRFSLLENKRGNSGEWDLKHRVLEFPHVRGQKGVRVCVSSTRSKIKHLRRLVYPYLLTVVTMWIRVLD